MPKLILASTLMLLLGWLVPAQGNEPEAEIQYQIESKIYRVMTNITGNGLTSRTLPGLNGSFHVVHSKLNDVELVMEGETLTWDGNSEPDHPFIVPLAKPRIRTLENLAASIVISDETELQFFEHAPGGLFALRSLEVGESAPGIELGVTPRSKPDEEGRIELDFKFRVTSVNSRETLEGVKLNVGRPILRTTRAEGLLTVRDGEWACYQTAVESRGHLYLFLRVEAVHPQTANAPDDEIEAVRRAFLDYQKFFGQHNVPAIVGAHDIAFLSRQFDTFPEKIRQLLREEHEGYSDRLFELIANAKIDGVEIAAGDIRTAFNFDPDTELYLVHAADCLWIFQGTAEGMKTLGHDFEGEIAREMSRLNIRFHPNK